MNQESTRKGVAAAGKSILEWEKIHNTHPEAPDAFPSDGQIYILYIQFRKVEGVCELPED